VARCDSLNACAAKYTRRLQKILVKVGEEVVREDKRVCVVASANKMNFKWRLDMITNTHTVTLQDVAFGKFETVKLWDSHTNPPAASNVRGQTPLRKLEVGYDMFQTVLAINYPVSFSTSVFLSFSRILFVVDGSMVSQATTVFAGYTSTVTTPQVSFLTFIRQHL